MHEIFTSFGVSFRPLWWLGTSHYTYIASAKRFYSKWSGIDVFRYNTIPENWVENHDSHWSSLCMRYSNQLSVCSSANSWCFNTSSFVSSSLHLLGWVSGLCGDYNTMPENWVENHDSHCAWDIPTSFLYVPLSILDVLMQALLYNLLYIFWGEFQASVVTYNLRSLCYEG